MEPNSEYWKTKSEKGCLTSCLKDNILVILTVCGVVFGVVLGVTVRGVEPSQDVVIWIGLPGDVYMRMLKMMILPLIICSIIAGTASLDPKCNGRVSVIALSYIVGSNFLSCIVPMAVAFVIQPGVGVQFKISSIKKKNEKVLETVDVFVDLIRNLFPDNVVAACFRQAQTAYDLHSVTYEHNKTVGEGVNATWELQNMTVHSTIKTVGSAESTNVIGLVLCCLTFGLATASLGSKGKPFLEFFLSANEVIIKILRWFIWTTPVGVASLIAVAFLETSNLDSAVRSLGMLSLSVLSSLAIYQLVLVPLFYYLIVRENPYKLLLSMGRPWLVSFAAASSAVAIPETLVALETKKKVDSRLTRFVVPFATTINRDGSCIFITVSCIFISQLVEADLHPGKVILLWILTTLISLAIPSVPSAGVVAVVINLTAMGIPVDLVGMLFATEWLLDRFRSGSNMLSHAHCTMVTYKFCKNYLPPLDPDQVVNEMEVISPMLKSDSAIIGKNDSIQLT